MSGMLPRSGKAPEATTAQRQGRRVFGKLRHKDKYFLSVANLVLHSRRILAKLAPAAKMVCSETKHKRFRVLSEQSCARSNLYLKPVKELTSKCRSAQCGSFKISWTEESICRFDSRNQSPEQNNTTLIFPSQTIRNRSKWADWQGAR